MKYAKPIINRAIYHQLIEHEIKKMLDEMIYSPIIAIAENANVSRASLQSVENKRGFLNSLAGGTANRQFQNIGIVIENPKGSKRIGKNWIQHMSHDYGYIVATEAIDGDELDVFVGENTKASKFYVVEQCDPDTGDFDEYKIMFGFNDINEAEEGYLANYQTGWRGIRHIQEYDMDYFWPWYRTTRVIHAFENAVSNALKKSLMDGHIVYMDGFFTGKFNAAIGLEMRKLGARFNHLRKAYAIPRDQLPMDLQVIMSKGEAKLQDKVKSIYQHLEDLKKNKSSETINFEPQFAGILIDLDKQFSSTFPKGLNIPMHMSPYVKEQLKKNYTNNLNLYINDWYDTAIVRLRRKVQDNVVEGYRASNLIGVIQSERNVSANKAKFLAASETSLLVSKYREVRYKEAGVNKYKWLTSMDERVRPNFEARKTRHTSNNHRKLNNRIFSWDEPPIVDSATGRRCNPGEDFGPCRCVAVPIISD